VVAVIESACGTLLYGNGRKVSEVQKTSNALLSLKYPYPNLFNGQSASDTLISSEDDIPGQYGLQFSNKGLNDD